MQPSMEQSAPEARTLWVNAVLVNVRLQQSAAPWSVLKISGVPKRSAASSASTQKAVHDVRQPPRQHDSPGRHLSCARSVNKARRDDGALT